MSSRSWLSYSYQSRFHLTPLSYESLEYASGFASEQCPEGIVAISTNTLRLFASYVFKHQWQLINMRNMKLTVESIFFLLIIIVFSVWRTVQCIVQIKHGDDGDDDGGDDDDK